MESASGAFIYSKPPNNYRDLAKQRARLAREIESVHDILPQLAILDDILEREIYSESYSKIINKIQKKCDIISGEWEKLRSTK
jgi:hypothetical protein